MTTARETNERIKEWIGIGTFAVLAGMFIVGCLLLSGTMP